MKAAPASLLPSAAPLPEMVRKFFDPIRGPLAELEELLKGRCEQFDPGVAACVSYVSANPGKRLRPALVFYAGAAVSGRPLADQSEELLKAGLIVELVHIATLVHDDILDGATFRRNRLTAAAKWGPEISVLLGDCLFAHALTLAAEYPTPFVCRRVSEATNVVCSGEILQTQRRFDLALRRPDYIKMIEMKTGALFGLACELGGFLRGAEPRRQDELREFGNLLGIAYQIYDDIVDLVGDETETGKSLGTDLQKGKLTLPVLLLLEQIENGEHQVVSSLLLNEHGNARAMLLESLHRHGAVGRAAAQGMEYVDAAEEKLAGLGENEGSGTLRSILELLRLKLAAFRA
ncbi:MAG: polyprenyl synthetase family protein [Verrucomicrobiae bacterium]|nr:polyprenyl synthetase family protein [Verrucomicrobiae bacterium]